MSSWANGYVSEIDYTYGYFPELNPTNLSLALLTKGIMPPKVKTACELGIGQGLSLNIHAAASDTEWHGNDFNPAQVSFANELATASGANANITDEAFVDFCKRDDLPGFDFIGLHGIWSWVSEENRSVIKEFLAKKLNVGGVVYISYNTLPGWSANAPLRQLFHDHFNHYGTNGAGIKANIDSSLEFLAEFAATNPKVFPDPKRIQDLVKTWQNKSDSYLAHEFLNRDWHPLYFAEMAKTLNDAKLTFACTANYQEMYPHILYSEGQKKLLAGIQNAEFRETMDDYILGRQFRYDYWIKGARKLHKDVRISKIRDADIILSMPVDVDNLTYQGSMGEITLNAKAYIPVIEYISDHKVHKIGDIEQAIKGKNIGFPRLLQVVNTLISMKHISLVQDPETIQKACKQSAKLNSTLQDRALSLTETGCLASPVTGGAIPATKTEKLFLKAIQAGKTSPEEWAKDAQKSFEAIGEYLIVDSKALKSPGENLSRLRTLAKQFSKNRVQLLKELMIIQ